MKTTIDIPNTLWHEARKLAVAERTTMKALVTEGLRLILAERREKKAFQLRSASFRGQGRQPQTAGASWEHIREMAYEGRDGN